MLFDFKFKSFFYKNDRKQPDLWSFFITFVAESSGLAIFWSWILTSFLADRSQNWSICIKIQIKLRYSVQKSSRSVCREARNLKNKKIKWRYLEAKWAHVGKSQVQFSGNTVKSAISVIWLKISHLVKSECKLYL